MNHYLLDTHIWLWMQAEPERLGERAQRLIGSTRTTLLLSAASAWEIAIKHALGKLTLPETPATYVPDRCRRTRTTPLPIELSHALRAGDLPTLHRDPFDRMIVAQAQALRVPVITVDTVFEGYDVETIRD